ncbi:MAG TPA: universal stress protein [Chitinophagales bacterium]|nr:universal stress protein [Chitinophagales bacterium]
MASNTDQLTIKKILVPTDFSEISLHALNYAARIAKLENSEIIMLHVFESYTQNTMLNMRIDFTEIVERGVEEKFKEIKAKNPDLEGVTIHSRVVVGKIHAEIDNTAAQENVKLIVMGTHGVSGVTNIGKFIIGSNAYRTIQNAPCPIITLREVPHRREIKNIVVPLDSTRDSLKKMDIAIRWGKFLKAKIHVVAVTAFFEELKGSVKHIEEKLHDVENKLKQEDIEYESQIIRHHSPSDSVLEYAYKIHADLIIIVTGQEAQWSEMLFGSSARNVISDSSIPVLSINIHEYQAARE